MEKYLKHIFLPLFLFLSTLIFGQNYKFDNYNNQDGLVQSQVKAILQDHHGYLWIGTVGGLSMFDSHEFVNFNKKNGLLDNNITCLYEDQNNRLWVGSEGGISLRVSNKFTSYRFPESLSRFKVLDIYALDEKTLLLATNGSGLITFDTESTSFEFNTNDKDYIRKLELHDGRLLLATSEGLYTARFEDLYERSLFNSVLRDVSISDVESKGQELWVSSYRRGVFCFSKGDYKNYTMKDGLVRNDIRDIAFQGDDKIWFASNSGISCLHGSEFMVIDATNGLNNTDIKQLLIDKRGTLWLASNGLGIYRFSGWIFSTLNKDNALHSDLILSLCKDTQGNTWLGSYDKGLAIKTKEGEIIPQPEAGLNSTWSLLADDQDRIWIGKTSELMLYENGTYRSLRDENIFTETRITSLLQDSNGTIWIGHKNGLSKYENGIFSDVSASLNLPIRRVKSIVEHGSMLWIGCQNGLFSFDGNMFDHYDETKGLSDNDINSLAFDTYDRLWIGTKSSLDVLEDGHIQSVDFSDKVNDPVNFLHLESNKLFIGSNFGLHVLNTSERLDYLAPNIRHFSASYGLPTNECNLNAIAQFDDKELFFGTSRGLIKVNLVEMNALPDVPAPDLHINGLRIFMLNKDLSENSNSIDSKTGLYQDLLLNPEDNHVTFDFTGISFTSPDEVRYKYRLLGTDQDWLPATKSNFATYSNLPHGEYTFEIIAADQNSAWSTVPLKYDFSIDTPFYLTTWFIALCTMLALSIFYIIYLWRKRVVQKKIETELILTKSKLIDLEQQSLNSSMNRHFIFNALNSIQYYINRQDKRSANIYLSNFAKLIRKNLDSTESNWTTLNEELERIELYLSMEHMRFKDQFEYEIEIAEDVDIHQIEIPPMLFQPFLENSIWHGILPKKTKGKLILDIRKENDLMKITIKDDGIGLQQSEINKNGQLNHDSKGVQIINNRINLFRKMTQKDFDIVGPKEIVDPQGLCIGTQVIINMPIVKSMSIKKAS